MSVEVNRMTDYYVHVQRIAGITRQRLPVPLPKICTILRVTSIRL